jgi:hypothetical protein
MVENCKANQRWGDYEVGFGQNKKTGTQQWAGLSSFSNLNSILLAKLDNIYIVIL